MGFYNVEVLPSALREWAALAAKSARQEVADALEELARDPRPPKSFRLVVESKRRLYLGRAIVVYLVDDEVRQVWVLAVVPREARR